MTTENQNLLAAEEPEWFRRAISFIEENYTEKLQVADLAEHLGLSRSGFCHLFKKQTGLSPYEYVIDYRIGKAKEYLRNTDLSVREIALIVGFNSSANFVKCFREHLDMTPVMFREKERKYIG